MHSAWKRRLIFGLLYFSEGAPIGFIWWAMPSLLREEGVAIDRITALTSTLLLPWMLKFLWAPVIDVAQSPRWTLKHWILSAQAVMVVAILPLCFLSPSDAFGTWMVLLCVHGFAAATQDAAIDAMAIRTVPPEERGLVNGAMQTGMLAGRSLFGGAILVVAGRLGHAGVMALLAVCVAAVMIVVLRLPAIEPADRGPGHLRAFVGTLVSVFRMKTTWAGLLFALLSGAAFEAAGAMAGPMLIDAGAAVERVGVFFALPVVGAMIGGAMVGGLAADRLGVRRSCAGFLLGFTAAVAAVGFMWLNDPAPQILFIVLSVLYLFIGMFTAASYTLFMNLTVPALGATQFCLFMAATNACEAWSGRLGGYIAAGHGYGPALLVLCGVSLAGALLLPLLGGAGCGTSRDFVE